MNDVAAPHGLLDNKEIGIGQGEIALPEVGADSLAETRRRGLPTHTNALTDPQWIDDFRPHPLLRSGHLQTAFGALITGSLPPYAAVRHVIGLADGEAMVVHEEQRSDLTSEAPVAVLVHGLGGDHRSPYMRRIAARLSRAGVRVWRVDLRGCGAGLTHAYRPAHAGSSGDLAAVLATAQSRFPKARLSVAAFSLGGNILLKMLGELADQPGRFSLDPSRITQAIAVAPPADLAGCCANMERLSRVVYTRYYLKMLARQVQSRAEQWEPWRAIQPTRRPRTIRQFDHWYTAPLSGFASTDEYYALSSSSHWLARIEVPTRLLLDQDDPIIPIKAFDGLTFSPSITIQKTRFGGHLGYIARNPRGGLRRWLDDWVVQAMK